MQETFERVTERHGGKAVPVKHFYRRQYQIVGVTGVRFITRGLKTEKGSIGLSR